MLIVVIFALFILFCSSDAELKVSLHLIDEADLVGINVEKKLSFNKCFYNER